MDDTIPNSRQKKILELLKTKGKLSSSAIYKSLKPDIKASKVTIIRDLQHLKKESFIEITGKARATMYDLPHMTPLLEYIDIESYFEVDEEKRQGKKEFQKDIFKHLHALYTDEEKSMWESSTATFTERRKKLNPTIYKRELERFIIEFSWKSSQIEGNTYELLETETLIKEHIEAKGHSKEEARMILNHKDAFDTIVKNKSKFKTLSVPTIMQLHNVMVKGLGISTGLRNQEVRITGTSFVPPSDRSEIETLLRRTTEHINQTTYPPEKALIAACIIAYLQPFADGNKCIGRMLSNALLLAYDYFPLSYRNVDVTEYRKAMIVFYEQNNLYHLKHTFLGQRDFAMKKYFL